MPIKTVQTCYVCGSEIRKNPTKVQFYVVQEGSPTGLGKAVLVEDVIHRCCFGRLKKHTAFTNTLIVEEANE